jgi:hypothetical protein
MHTDSWGECSSYTTKRENPDRLWVNAILRFPGTGREYPIQPGEAKVVAMDALNHTTVSGRDEFPDLSRAQFEQVGNEADPDNPGAANMIRAFNVSITATLGHGIQNGGVYSYGLALPGAEAAALKDTLVQVRPNGSPTFPGKQAIAGIPASYVLDVFSNDLNPTRRAFLRSINFGSEPCPTWLAPNFERRPAELYWDALPDAIRRKSLGLSAAGREILQRTRTSARDLEYGPKLQRSLTKP